jgi:hypothetical protein
MDRHAHTQPIGVITKPKKRERTPRSHRRFVSETASASNAIDANRCPNDRAQLVDGRCSKCHFRIRVIPPLPHSPRATFNRRWIKKVGGYQT